MKFKDTRYGDLTGKVYKGMIDVSNAHLTSLEGAPKEVTGDFFCHYNRLTSLEFGPQTVGGNYVCSNNKKLTSLEGAPTKVWGSFICNDCKLESVVEILNSKLTKFIGDGNKNKFLTKEYYVRKENPKMSEHEVMTAMYKLTKSVKFLPIAVRKIFLIKSKK